MAEKRVIVVGAGIGGLAAALSLASAGLDVIVLERAATVGGKMRALPVAGRLIEAGPTVFTMRWVFDALLAEAGTSLEAELTLRPASLLARHAWNARDRLDLFADIAQSADAIGVFAGTREAEGYRRFCARAAEVYRTLEGPFIRSDRPSPVDLAQRVGLSGIGSLWRIQPFATLWSSLGEYFRDPRLRQLFGRYATYCGASPFAAPATLMLVAHVEQAGVWTVDGGLSHLARTVAGLAERKGARLRTESPVTRILTEGGRVSGVELAGGERVAADAVIANADVAALADGFLGPEAVPAGDRVPARERSLSALTFCLEARSSGFGLGHHTVFFSADYRAEFDTILRQRRLPADPTVYVCAQDRDDGGARPDGPERLLLLVNAPADGRERPLSSQEIAACEKTLLRKLSACGLALEPTGPAAITRPEDFAALFPGTGGALYGRASHGWTATFKRPGARTRVPGLYLAGGSVHPGPGVPMAAQSGRLAAAALRADLASTDRSHAAAMSGGMSMR